MGSVIKMYGLGAGDTQDGLAQIDVPMNGNLLGIQWAIRADLDADTEFVDAQLSFRSMGTFNTNDDRGIISEVRAQSSLTTSGTIPGAFNFYTQLPDIPVAAGERLYLNLSSTTGVAARVSALLHFSFNIDSIASRRR